MSDIPRTDEPAAAAAPNQCKHGHLARVCEICELERELAEARAERDIARTLSLFNKGEAERQYESAEKLKAELADARAEIAILKEELKQIKFDNGQFGAGA